jgi:hypothetical protein
MSLRENLIRAQERNIHIEAGVVPILEQVLQTEIILSILRNSLIIQGWMLIVLGR